MPYINPEKRKQFEPILKDLYVGTAGDLNYLITSIVKNYLWDYNCNYQAYNEAIGALECAKLELYRRHTAPYEDGAIERNGDV